MAFVKQLPMDYSRPSNAAGADSSASRQRSSGFERGGIVRPSEWHGQRSEFSRAHGQMYCWKVARNFGQCVNLSAYEIEHGRFRALFAGSFCPKMQNGRTLPKNKKN